MTPGLAPFVGREIDQPATGENPGAVYNRALSLTSYLMQQGPVIRDGDTIEASGRTVRIGRGERDGVATWRLKFAAQ